MTTRIPTRRLRSRSGNILMEFVVVAGIMTPLVAGTFVTGINLVRSIQANHMARDIADMYIHGSDFSSLGMQQVAVKLAKGLQLNVGGATSGTNANNTSNGGNGIVWVSQIRWVGATNQPTCQGVLPASCTNTNKFVLEEQVSFGNINLQGTGTGRHETVAGHASATRDMNGHVTVDKVKDSTAQIPEPYQTALYNLWQTTHTGAGNVPLNDGQVLYIAEVFFYQTGSMAGSGVYARWFF